MKRSDLRPITDCYKEAFHGAGELAIPAAGFVWCIACLVFMPVFWCFAWCSTLFMKEDKPHV